MKKILLFAAFAIYSGVAFSDTVIIVNSGFTFSPNDVTINTGDIVDFQLGSMHNTVEVSEATWLENGNTPLPGGFSTPFSGGQVTDLSEGVHFYVCSPHASGGMKGKITVVGTTGINEKAPGFTAFNIYPNPSNGKFTLQYNGSGSSDGSSSANNQKYGLEIIDLNGEKIFELQDFNLANSNEIDISSIPEGLYFVRINDRKSIYTQKLIKQ
jgi:plastocyanin